ncbi:MAG TPA: type II secretion system protein M [Usitatibacter sp.]|jgi:general secretion pathway protein M|nr:type II secretion system protein M [Usitatibacter sp.]
MNAPAIWRSRSPRERRVLAWGGGLVAALLFVALAWLPLARTHARIEAELPQLRASLAALERQADEVKRLRGIPVVASSATPAGSMPALPGAQVSIPAPGRVHVVAGDVAFSALLDWLAAVQGAQGLHVESAHLEALPTSGRVRADLTLARS